MKPRPLSQDAIEGVLNTRIRPWLALDDATVEVERLDVENGAVALRFGGRYRGCPSRRFVLEKVVQPVLEQELAGLSSLRLAD